MTFSQRNKLGFKLALQKDVELFFGLGSVTYAVSQSLASSGGGSGNLRSLLGCEPHMLYRMARAKHISKKEGRPIRPKDLFGLKGFMVAGTDNRCYKDELEELWGIRPMEIFAGTEPSLIGTESWTRNGMYFFPDSCFYEFPADFRNVLYAVLKLTFAAYKCEHCLGFSTSFDQIDLFHSLRIGGIAAESPDGIGRIQYDASVAERFKCFGHILASIAGC